MGKEFELKFQADPETLRKIREKYGEFIPIRMESRYFDTPEAALGQRRWTLRLRKENGVSVCGLKTPGENLIRGEWEVESEDLDSGIKELCKLDVPQDFPSLVSEGLVEVCAADFLRLARRISWGECVLELALDQGVFLGGGRRREFSEVEAELKQGSRQAVEDFGRALAAEFSLKEGTVSKFERALALAKGE